MPRPRTMHRSAYDEALADMLAEGVSEQAALAALAGITVIGDNEPLPDPFADVPPDVIP